MTHSFEFAPCATCAPGRVTIAGAGPGDAELLTVKVLRLIRSAQAIVHDALISDEIRALFPPEARLYDVGKRGGRAASARQEDINQLLVELAREGLEVLRLKGGDPFVFGRGAEEALYLQAHGIPWEAVPGVSAANGVGAAGIPLTHRGLSASVTFLNGFAPYLDDVDWRALVALGGTWVFYMGRRSVAEIARRLLAHGAAPALQLALIESATLPEQAVTLLPLPEVARGAMSGDAARPGLVVVGPVVELAHTLSSSFTEFAVDVSTLPSLSEITGKSRPDRGWR
ncbi:MAG: uroporphyrinogen-III C-methyltransferase [SAR324 cluster bacterium]|nr:uroporphyrinogen-III C-methyltransferase [SAR324 cluster bacterium]MCZ6646328.1 uroporphyrinogen-III C-methyltransferase [SAR324 cluster bacterium]